MFDTSNLPAGDVEVGDVFADLRVTVFDTTSLGEMQVLSCYVEGYNGGETLTIILPREHKVNVYRL